MRGDVTWQLIGDPLVSPVIVQDAEFGLVRIRSSYEATLVRESDGIARLLEIRRLA